MAMNHAPFRLACLASISLVSLLWIIGRQLSSSQTSALPIARYIHPKSLLGIPHAHIYVISLPQRFDRRKDMERLRTSLDLQWTYIEATDSFHPRITQILHSVSEIRRQAMKRVDMQTVLKPVSHESLTPPFSWPANLYDIANSSKALKLSNINSRYSTSTTPPRLSCATENFTIMPLSYDLPPQQILTKGRVACWDSHLSLIHRLANSPEDGVSLILEDDVDMERDISVRLSAMWKELPDEWDIIFLGHCWSDETFHPPFVTLPRFSISLYPSNGPKCTHAYALSHLGARRLFLHLTYTPFAYSRALDQAFAWLVQSGRLKAFSVVPSLIGQRKLSKSDIAEATLGKWNDELESGVLELSEGYA